MNYVNENTLELRPRVIFVITLLLALGYLFTGTDIYFGLMMIFTMLFSFAAINGAGGLSKITGMFVLFFFLKTIGIAQIVKCILVQPAESNLLAADETALAFLLGSFVIFCGVIVDAKFPIKARLIEPVSDPKKLKWIGYACLALTFSNAIFAVVGKNSAIGQVLIGILSYLNVVRIIAPIAFTASKLIETNREEFFSWPLVYSLISSTIVGLMQASKQVVLEPFFAMFLVAHFFGYKNRRNLVLVIVVTAIAAIGIVWPLSQLRKGQRLQGTFMEKTEILFEFISNRFSSFDDLQEAMELANQGGMGSEDSLYYFGTPISVLDRFSMMQYADMLIYATQKQGREGYDFLFDNIEIIPRAITGNRDRVSETNYYGHKMGLLADDDNVTAIATTPIGNSWSIDGNRGIIVLMFVIYTLIFMSNRLIGHDMYGNIWSISTFMYIQHPLVEGSINLAYFYLIRLFVFNFIVYYGLSFFADQMVKSSTIFSKKKISTM